MISAWMDKEGWINKTLAQKLHLSERAISSLRNNGSYHGLDAITRLANLMGRNPEDLYLHEASS
jgi:plasmid maintenance system antidote protein VapI